MAWTTIRIKSESLQRLKGVGKKGENYDDVLKRILDLYQLYEGKGVPPVCPTCGSLLLGIIGSQNKAKIYCYNCGVEYGIIVLGAEGKELTPRMESKEVTSS